MQTAVMYLRKLWDRCRFKFDGMICYMVTYHRILCIARWCIFFLNFTQSKLSWQAEKITCVSLVTTLLLQFCAVNPLKLSKSAVVANELSLGSHSLPFKLTLPPFLLWMNGRFTLVIVALPPTLRPAGPAVCASCANKFGMFAVKAAIMLCYPYTALKCQLEKGPDGSDPRLRKTGESKLSGCPLNWTPELHYMILMTVCFQRPKVQAFWIRSSTRRRGFLMR